MLKWIQHNVGELYIFKHSLYILGLEHARMLILIKFVILVSIITIVKHCHACLIL